MMEVMQKVKVGELEDGGFRRARLMFSRKPIFGYPRGEPETT